MHITVRATNIELRPELTELGKRRARLALGRFASRITCVSLVLSDENGPRGGVDTTCRLHVLGWDGWRMTLTALDDTPEKALTGAVARAGRTVARRVERMRDARAPRSSSRWWNDRRTADSESRQ